MSYSRDKKTNEIKFYENGERIYDFTISGNIVVFPNGKSLLISCLEFAVGEKYTHLPDAKDIGNVALFLVSDDSDYVTGQVINVCGGNTVGVAR